jgi:hypothetical protein
MTLLVGDGRHLRTVMCRQRPGVITLGKPATCDVDAAEDGVPQFGTTTRTTEAIAEMRTTTGLLDRSLPMKGPAPPQW